ncbi:GNAT family N-acetyltransferase [Paenibacillus wenxiniae]|uniref:GNAT family N-acetyltransferase n=1 Tax=Paenibacillus wenxiniae TaxID=1636843 RepID=A0ABW4RN53_9BACL
MAQSRSIMKLELNHTRFAEDVIDHDRIVTGAINWDDLSHVSHLFYESYHNTVDDEGETPAEWEQELQQVKDGKYGPVLYDLSFNLYAAEQLIGSIVCSKFKGIHLILYIIISPVYRGRRLSKVLLRETIRSARQSQLDSLYLVVTDSNVAATRTYDAIGFEKVGTDWGEVFKESVE